MEKEKKMIKKDYFAILAELVKGTEREVELTEFINREIELLNKKRTGQTKSQKENEGLVEVVYNALVELGKPATASEIQAQVNNKADVKMSNQKVSALLKKLKDTNRIVRVEDKKKAYFSIAE